MSIGELFILGFFGKTIPEWLKQFAGRHGLGGVILFDYSCQTQKYDNNIESPQQLRGLCREIGQDPAVVSHRYALSMPGVATVILGVKNRDELKQCVDAEAAGPLEPALMARFNGLGLRV